MAAVVQILSYHGASPSGSDITNIQINFKRADSDAADLNNPVPIAEGATAYSWSKYTKISVVSGLSNQIGNIRWFAEAAPEDWANSVSMFAAVTANYTQPNSGEESVQIASSTNVNSYTSGSPLTVNSAANAITSTGTGSQSYVRQQIAVLSTATSGLKTPRVIVYRYNES